MRELALREFHSFQAGGKDFVYLVPSAAVFELDDASSAVSHRLRERSMTRLDLARQLSALFPAHEVQETVSELMRARAIGEVGVPEEPTRKLMPPENFPLTTMVLNVTNQCNLSCTYCYEYGEDKIVDTENGKKSKFMSEQTARESVDFMLRESGENRLAHLTFFGGETLMNFPVPKTPLQYARKRAAESRQKAHFTQTPNAPHLRPHSILLLTP